MNGRSGSSRSKETIRTLLSRVSPQLVPSPTRSLGPTLIGAHALATRTNPSTRNHGCRFIAIPLLPRERASGIGTYSGIDRRPGSDPQGKLEEPGPGPARDSGPPHPAPRPDADGRRLSAGGTILALLGRSRIMAVKRG